MRKVYLTHTVPEPGSGLKLYESGKWPEDIKQKLIAHVNEERQMKNIPPSLKMMPLAKYQTSKWAKQIEDFDEPAKVKVKTTWLEAAINKLPTLSRAKGRRLAKKLAEYHEKQDGFFELLYDLTTTTKKLKSKREDLEGAIAFLKQAGVPATQYNNKLGDPTKWV